MDKTKRHPNHEMPFVLFLKRSANYFGVGTLAAGKPNLVRTND